MVMTCMRKLIVVDVDGTLVNDKKEITPRTRDALISAITAGHEVMIASGRSTYGIRNQALALEFDKYGGILSAYNGGTLYDFKEEKILADHPLDFELTKEILEFSKDLDLALIIYKGKYLVTDKPDDPYVISDSKIVGMEIKAIDNISENIDFTTNKILFAADPDKIDQPAKKLKEKFGDRTEQVRSTRFYYEIMPVGLSKGASVLEACKIFGIDREDTIVFGDEMNDMSMFEVAGTGVAMANAVESIKKAADFVTKSNNEDGIAYYLENFLLNKENK